MVSNEVVHSSLEQARNSENGIDFWFARDLQELFGYTRWESFEKVVLKAAENCRAAGVSEDDHFRQVTKKVQLGSGAEREVVDYALTRYAAYLVTLNADSGKPQVAFLKHYFAVRAREAEVVEQRVLDAERVENRAQLRATEKALSKQFVERGLDGREVAIVRSKGDKALFGGLTTKQMKEKYNISETRALADFLPTLSLAAKTLVNEMTKLNVEERDLRGEPHISAEHVQNSKSVRAMLGERGIRPERLPAGEDVAKIERRLASEERALAKEGLGEIEPE